MAVTHQRAISVIQGHIVCWGEKIDPQTGQWSAQHQLNSGYDTETGWASMLAFYNAQRSRADRRNVVLAWSVSPYADAIIVDTYADVLRLKQALWVPLNKQTADRSVTITGQFDVKEGGDDD